jgi:hypothetical protein
MHYRSIEEIRKRFVEYKVDAVLNGLIMHGENQAKLIKLACEERLDGTNHWSLRLLSEKFVTIEGHHVSHETIRKTLRDSDLKP